MISTIDGCNMGNYRTTYMELDDFRVSCIQGYPYEGFVIGCGYAYVENIPSEMPILENSSYIYNPIKVQQIDTSCWQLSRAFI